MRQLFDGLSTGATSGPEISRRRRRECLGWAIEYLDGGRDNVLFGGEIIMIV